MMSARTLTAAILSFLALGTAGCTAVAEPSKVAFVREVYADELRAFQQWPPQQGASSALFSRETQDLQRAAKAGPGPKLDGPILHTLFGWHVFPNFRVELKSVEASQTFANRGKVSVALTVNEAPREIIVSVSEDCWAGSATIQYCIDDLQYDNGTSYKAYLKSLAQP